MCKKIFLFREGGAKLPTLPHFATYYKYIRCPVAIYILSFERSELEGKYSLIVSVCACMFCVWGMSFGCCMWRHYVVCSCCIHGRFSPVLLGISSGYSE